MTVGIYKYTDKKTGEVVYIGKDSHIDINKRRSAHSSPSGYDKQRFNRILQNNPDRYEYGVIWVSDDCSTLKLNKMEILFGKIYNPKFNFGKFGKGGCTGHTEETKRKISESLTGITRSEETKRKMSESCKGKIRCWKDYPRIVNHGYMGEKQRYCIKYKGEVFKTSIDIHKLIKWWNETHPTEPIHVEVNNK